ncbi:hypothetical protein BDW74DRAFT_177696 [Aspergillus multicolor]|uniref:uncharacterized protein n=1 Tax=Aspergillus multicolor TaxID=41759 RepID=UPI003CCD6CD8
MDPISVADEDFVTNLCAPPKNPHLSQGQRILQDHYADVHSLVQNCELDISTFMAHQTSPSTIRHHIRRLRTKTLLELTTDLQVSHGCDAEAAKCLLTFIARVWLMCWIGPLPDEASMGQTCIPWSGDTTLAAALNAHFNPAGGNLYPREDFQRGSPLRACNLERFGGIRILWTSNLADHLRLHDPPNENEPYTLYLFQHVAFLAAHKASGILPPGLVAETLDTLALLVPRYDSATKKWFARKEADMKGSLDPEVRMARGPGMMAPLEAPHQTTGTRNFQYWGERLAILKNAYDASEPRTVRQWWTDRRRRVQWATFWIAALVLILTVLFGIVQSVEGGLQVYKAYHPG